MLKTKIIELEDRGRPLRIEIQEMPARKLESWAVRAILAIGKGNTGVNGVEGIASLLASQTGGSEAASGNTVMLDRLVTVLLGLDWEKAEPLLDEMMACCYKIDGNIKTQLKPAMVDANIEDVRTIVRLQTEALRHNFAFFTNDAPLNSPERVSVGKPRLE